MTPIRWMLLIGGMAIIGLARVAQQTSLRLKSYEVGRRTVRLHELENQTQWMRAQVVGAQSPMHLARLSKERKLNLVAWSVMPVPVSVIGHAALPAPMRVALDSANGSTDE